VRNGLHSSVRRAQWPGTRTGRARSCSSSNSARPQITFLPTTSPSCTPAWARSPFIKTFTLTLDERADLLAFLATLTDEKFLNDPRHADPDAAH
jgi:hypothetical protein